MKMNKFLAIFFLCMFMVPASYGQGFEILYKSYMLGCGTYFSKNLQKETNDKKFIAEFSFNYCECTLLELKKIHCSGKKPGECEIDKKNPTKEEDKEAAVAFSKLASEHGVTSGKMEKCLKQAFQITKK